MMTEHLPFGPILSLCAPLRQAFHQEGEFSQIEESLHGIRTTLEALRLEAERNVGGEEDDEVPRGGRERR